MTEPDANFTITTTADPIESLELRDHAASSRLVLAPARGGMVTRLQLAGRELLFLDEATLRDATKNVRGGIPVLFPSPGKLEADTYRWRDHIGHLKQHGFARNASWQVVRSRSVEGASVTLAFEASAETRSAFPWDFCAEYTYTLRERALRIAMHFTQIGGKNEMPFGAGFHPYFRIPNAAEKSSARIETNATLAFDNVTKKTAPLALIDLTATEVDLHLVDHTGDCTLRCRDYGVRLRGSSELSRWVVWTLAGKDFVCVEPWTCPGNALNTGDSVLTLEPGQSRSLWVEIALV